MIKYVLLSLKYRVVVLSLLLHFLFHISIVKYYKLLFWGNEYIKNHALFLMWIFFGFCLLITHLFPQMTTLLRSLRNNLSHPHSTLFQIISTIHMALRLWSEYSIVLKSGMSTGSKPVQWYLILDFFLDILGEKLFSFCWGHYFIGW